VVLHEYTCAACGVFEVRRPIGSAEPQAALVDLRDLALIGEQARSSRVGPRRHE
jgi:hypothetical protein